MKSTITLVSLLFATHLLAQSPAQEALEGQKTPEQRYDVMKSKSQTYGDYKVIKEYILDGVWKISLDSIRAARAARRNAEDAILSLKKELENTRYALRQKEADQAEIVYDSNHISLLGIGFEKATFVGLMSVIITGLLLLLGMLTGKLRLVTSSVREKMELLSATHAEFDDYKRKALDRQTKLSRELQTERNRLMELGRG